MKILLAFLLGAASVSAAPKDCKHVVRTHFKSGKTKVEVVEMPAASNVECKRLAREREQQKADDVERVEITSSYRVVP